jgi:hypothetical protein
MVHEAKGFCTCSGEHGVATSGDCLCGGLEGDNDKVLDTSL